MSSLFARHLRRLSTTVSGDTAAAISSSISASRALAKLRTEHDPDKVLKIYSSVSDHDSSLLSRRYAQDLTVKRLAVSQRFSDVETLIESRKSDPKIKEEAFLSTLIRSYGVAGMFDHALKTYDQINELGACRSSISFNALLAACNQCKLFERVPLLFDEMPVKYSVVPDKVSYGILVKAYCEMELPEKAMEVVKTMEEKRIEVTAVTLTTILNVLYKKGMADEAKGIWDEMVKKGCELDVAAYNVRAMHAHPGKPEDVKALIEEMIDAGLKPDTISYNYLMTSYCKNGMMDEAYEVYRGMEKKGCRPNPTTYRTLISYLCKNESFEKGYKVFKQSVKYHKIPDFETLQHLVQGLVKRNKTKDAKGLIRTVKKVFPATLNDWKKIEEELGLVSSPDSSKTSAIA
uniref:Pentatricopeptide repeat-containing protein n=1 Tax=Kalanchoe fedtschenkoi TaxID=63787 RepID=A0A7N0RBK1_KALFE